MPEFDAPIAGDDDKQIKNLLGRKQPALIYFYDTVSKPLEDALNREAKRNADDLIIITADVNQTAQTYQKYGAPNLPALVTLTPAFFGRKLKSSAENVRPADVRAHVAHLLQGTALPEVKPTATPIDGKRSLKGARHVNNATWRKEVLKSDTPVLVDFWAAWCGPCNVIAPFIDDLADKYKGKVKVVKLNTEESKSIANQFKVQSIPTFIIFDGGQPVARMSGASPRAIENMVQDVLIPE